MNPMTIEPSFNEFKEERRGRQASSKKCAVYIVTQGWGNVNENCMLNRLRAPMAKVFPLCRSYELLLVLARIFLFLQG